MTEDEAKRAELLALRDRILDGGSNSTPEGKVKEMLLSVGLAGAVIVAIAVMAVVDTEPSSSDANMSVSSESANVDDADKDCFSSWDGSSAELVNLVSRLQAIPRSFQHLKTVVSPADGINHRSVVMEYSSKTGSGGQILGKAHAVIDLRNCAVAELSVNEK